MFKITINIILLTVLLSFSSILSGCTATPPVPSSEPVTATLPVPSSEPVIVNQMGGAGLLISECGDRQYISNKAEYIIEGLVKSVKSSWTEDKSAIYTYTDLAIEKYFKGAPFKENKLQIKTRGGKVGEVTMWVEDQPIFHEGKKVRIYFARDRGEFYIVCAFRGVEEILNPSTTP